MNEKLKNHIIIILQYIIVTLPDWQHYYEGPYSNIIQSNTTWWQKNGVFQIHTKAQPQQNITGPTRGSSFTWGLSSFLDFKGLPQKQVWQHFKRGCNPIFSSSCNLKSTAEQLKWWNYFAINSAFTCFLKITQYGFTLKGTSAEMNIHINSPLAYCIITVGG